MAYSKTSWVDRVVQYPTRYKDQNNTQYTFTPDVGTVTQAGTPVNASNLNKVESELEMLDSATLFEMATGDANAILLTTPTLVDGFQKNFVASANNNGLNTTINSIPVYKPNTTSAPTLISGQAYTARYKLSVNAYYIESYADKVHSHTVSQISDLTASATELNYVDGVTSPIQSQLNLKVSSSSYTATDVLNKIKTVDGTGSGLDSDTVDGLNFEVSQTIPTDLATNTVRLVYE
jgi:hypothetical protein